MISHRKCSDFFRAALDKSVSPHQVILVEGARQVGKTTFVKHVLSSYENVLSLNLEEDKVLRAEIDTAPTFEAFTDLLKLKGFKPSLNQIVFIDEAQESDKLGGWVRFMKEKWLNTRTILTGSSMTRLFREDQRVPVGRISRLLLQPFSLNEFISCSNESAVIDALEDFSSEKPPSEVLHRRLLEITDRYIEIGGLPEAALTGIHGGDYSSLRRALLLNQEEDFIRKSSIQERSLFMAALRGTANHIGFPAKYTHVAPSSREGESLIGVMKSWHLVHEIEQKGHSSTSSFFPKRYLYDPGIAQQVRNMPFPRLSILSSLNSALRTQLGGLFENLVVISLLQHKMGQIDLSSWKESSSSPREVDFVWRDDLILPIECKAAQKLSPRVFSSLKAYLRATNLRIGVLVSAAPFRILRDEKLVLVNFPIYLCQPEIIRKTILSLQ